MVFTRSGRRAAGAIPKRKYVLKSSKKSIHSYSQKIPFEVVKIETILTDTVVEKNTHEAENTLTNVAVSENTHSPIENLEERAPHQKQAIKFKTTKEPHLSEKDAGHTPACVDEPQQNNYQQPSMSFYSTELLEQSIENDLSGEVVLIGCSNSLTTVGDYKVNPESTDLLNAILAMHGDIAANCSFKSPSFRSQLMQCLCNIVESLKNSKIGLIAENEVRNMLEFLDDYERAGVEVKWLKIRLYEIIEAKEAIHELEIQNGRKAKIASTKVHIELYKRKIDTYVEHIRSLEEQIVSADSEISGEMEKLVESRDLIADKMKKLKHVAGLESLVQDLF